MHFCMYISKYRIISGWCTTTMATKRKRRTIHLPVAKSVWCTSMVMAKTYSASRNHTSFVRAFQTPDMCGSYAGSIRMLVRNWIRRHFLDWDARGLTLQSVPDVHMMGDSWGSWWQLCHLFLSSSTWQLVRMFRVPKTREPKDGEREAKLIKVELSAAIN